MRESIPGSPWRGQPATRRDLSTLAADVSDLFCFSRATVGYTRRDCETRLETW